MTEMTDARGFVGHDCPVTSAALSFAERQLNVPLQGEGAWGACVGARVRARGRRNALPTSAPSPHTHYEGHPVPTYITVLFVETPHVDKVSRPPRGVVSPRSMR